MDERLGLLMEQLRAQRVLLVLDNLEMLLEEGEGTGRMHAGLEGYARLLRRIGETRHQSCLLLTSREKPGDLVPLEGNRAPVRALRLARLDTDACQQLLAEKGVAGSVAEQMRLIEAYVGNPLALKIVAQTIVDLFDGQSVQTGHEFPVKRSLSVSFLLAFSFTIGASPKSMRRRFQG